MKFVFVAAIMTWVVFLCNGECRRNEERRLAVESECCIDDEKALDVAYKEKKAAMTARMNIVANRMQLICHPRIYYCDMGSLNAQGQGTCREHHDEENKKSKYAVQIIIFSNKEYRQLQAKKAPMESEEPPEKKIVK